MRDIAPENLVITEYASFVLAADIGGIGARFSIMGIGEKRNMILTHAYATAEIRSPHEQINELLREAYESYGITVKNGCIAVAGPTNSEHSHATLTNANLTLDARQLYQTTMLEHITIANDYEAVGYAFPHVDLGNDATWLQKETQQVNRVVLIGPGTGLGVCIVYKEGAKWHVMPTEASHMHAVSNLTYDELVSGRGLTHLYSLVKHQYSKAPSLDNSMEILASEHPAAKEALSLFLAFFGRIARNMALAVLPTHIFLVNGFSRSLTPSLQEENNRFMTEFREGKKFLQDIGIGILNTRRMVRLGAAEIATLGEEIGIKR